ncbi:Conserved_hypothetical protein [Hexamita inflata]|uniref:Uncharacterized protein n=1 Tax=Hexamita inflata TaxID=28002 RepID=A0AA86N794_9EUKA|nr:Conserved hypothetical protein [Hexamita inflata]
MDSLSVYSNLFSEFHQSGSKITPQIAQNAHELLHQLIIRNEKIHPNWGPFQTLVDDFLCSVAQLQNTQQTFKHVFGYFFQQQRFSKAAGCYMRYSLSLIDSINQCIEQNSEQNENVLQQLLQQLTRALAIALSTAQLSKQQEYQSEWGYSSEGQKSCLLQQIEIKRQQLNIQQDTDAGHAMLRENELHRLEEDEQRIRNAQMSSPVERFTVQQILQLFVYWDSILELTRVPSGFSTSNQRILTLRANEACKLKPFDCYLALVCRGDFDQALRFVKHYQFSTALLLQRLVKHVISLIQVTLKFNGQSKLRLTFQHNFAIPFSQMKLNLQDQSDEMKTTFQCISDVLALKQFTGHSSMLTFSTDPLVEIFIAACVEANSDVNYQIVMARFTEMWPEIRPNLQLEEVQRAINFADELFGVKWIRQFLGGQQIIKPVVTVPQNQPKPSNQPVNQINKSYQPTQQKPSTAQKPQQKTMELTLDELDHKPAFAAKQSTPSNQIKIQFNQNNNPPNQFGVQGMNLFPPQNENKSILKNGANAMNGGVKKAVQFNMQ